MLLKELYMWGKKEMDSAYLSVETAGKMVKKLLSMPRIVEYRPIAQIMTKQLLSQELGISEKGVVKISNFKAPHSLLVKVSLFLVRLYCKTKFIEE